MKSGYAIVVDIDSNGDFAWDVIDRETKVRAASRAVVRRGSFSGNCEG